MALKDKWFNKENGVDDIDAEDINDIAEAVIEIEKKGVKNGTTFTPSVSNNGDLSWTNDGGRPNPPTVNIKGKDGKSAYQSAIDGGYVGDEAEFNNSLSKVPEAIKEMRLPAVYRFTHQGGNYSQLEIPPQKTGDIFNVFVPVGWSVQIEFSNSSNEYIIAESEDETYKFEITEDRQVVWFFVQLNSGGDFLVKDCPVTITQGEFNRFEEIENKLGDIDTAFDIYLSPNLLNKETLTKGVGISKNGTEYASAANAVTDYISVKEGDVLSWQYLKTDGSNKTVIGNIRFVCAYDNNKNILSSKGVDSTIKSYEVPNGVAYVRITMQSYTNYINQMVHFGADILPYEPYESYYVIKEKAISNEVIENIAKEISESNSRPLTLPPTIYGFVGYPISIYFRNVMDYYPDDVYVRKYGASVKGKQYADRWEYTPTAAETVSGSIMVYDHNYNKLNDQSIPVEVKDSTIKDNLSVLVIGDSTVNAGKETQKMIDLAASDGYSLTLLGTRGSGANKHEGRSGWTAKMYVETAENNSIANAFYNPTAETFDFAYYMTQQGYSGVDCVFLQLGINDVFSATELTFADALNTYLSNMEIIINSIRTYDANIKIVINLVIPCGTNQDAFTGTYNLSTTTWRCKKNTYEANIALLNKFKSITNVYLSPYNAAIDTVNNLPKDVHPNDAGYEQLGTQMYSYMRAIN